MTIIYIVRHGETIENIQKILQGHMPGTLTDLGKEQVLQTAESLSEQHACFTRIVSSDLKRAMDSAKIIADKLNLSVVPMSLLRERDWRIFTGMSIAEASSKFRINGKWKFPEGTIETEEEIYERAHKTLKELQRLYTNETIIVVTHGQFARNLIAAHFNITTASASHIAKQNFHDVTPFSNAEVRIITL